MKKYIFLFALSSIISNAAFALDDEKMEDISIVKEKQYLLDKTLRQTRRKVDDQQTQLSITINELDSLKSKINQIENNLIEVKQIAANNIKQNKYDIENLNNVLKSHSNTNIILFSAICVAIVGITACLFYIIKKKNKSFLEEMICIDSKLIDVIHRQIYLQENRTEKVEYNSEVDHTLALNVANEIVRIEMNLSRMDSSIKGYKQLTKSIHRIREDYLLKGYEISELLGQKYNLGMKVIADFITDDTLPEGSQIITGMKKAQVLYNGVMIQAAEITVSQNI